MLVGADSLQRLQSVIHPSAFILYPFLFLHSEINPNLPLALTASQFRCRNFLNHVILNLIANLDVIEILEADAALKTFAYFASLPLKSFQQNDVTLTADNPVANQYRPRLSFY